VSDEWTVVRELLLRTSPAPRFVTEPSEFPAPVGQVLGPRWTLLEDTLVLVAPIDGGEGRLRLLYRSTGYGVRRLAQPQRSPHARSRGALSGPYASLGITWSAKRRRVRSTSSRRSIEP